MPRNKIFLIILVTYFDFIIASTKVYIKLLVYYFYKKKEEIVNFF